MRHAYMICCAGKDGDGDEDEDEDENENEDKDGKRATPNKTREPNTMYSDLVTLHYMLWK